MIANINQIQVCVYAAIVFGRTGATVFFRGNGLPSSALSPGIKDYPYPVKLVRVTNTVAVPVPYPVPVTRKVPYPVTVSKPVPYPVPHPIPVQITKPVLIRQAVPVPVVKPVLFPQPVFNPNHYLAGAGHTHHAYNNYMDYVKNQAYANHGYHHNYASPYLHNHSDPGHPAQGPDDGFDNSDRFNQENYGDYGQGRFDNQDNGYGVLSGGIAPPSISSEYGSHEFGSAETDSVDEGTANSQEVLQDETPAAVSSSDENRGSGSQQDEDTSNSSARRRR